MKEMYIIAGPNGAGKTTAAYALLPRFINANEYVNADSIAHALSPFKPEEVAIQAGKLMLVRIHELMKQNKDFAFETTLASRNFVRVVKDCKNAGYKTNLIFLWLPKVKLAMQRVKLRVMQGGHSIPVETIKRRHKRGLENLFKFYMPIMDNWWVYDNSGADPKLLAMQLLNESFQELDKKLWQLFQKNISGGL